MVKSFEGVLLQTMLRESKGPLAKILMSEWGKGVLLWKKRMGDLILVGYRLGPHLRTVCQRTFLNPMLPQGVRLALFHSMLHKKWLCKVG